MFNWKAHLQNILTGLNRTHGNEPLPEIELILRGILQIEQVGFYDRNGREFHPETTLRQVLEEGWQVTVRISGEPGTPPDESRFREGAPAPGSRDLSTEDRYDLFLREFVRLEGRHRFMWAGYIVRELLPRLGFPPDEAKVVLDRLRAENLVSMTKVPNPRNPDFPATGVQLNREHPRIRALLAEQGDLTGAPTDYEDSASEADLPEQHSGSSESR
jgi:hypothetical protein